MLAMVISASLDAINRVLSGGIILGYAVIGLFFLRFWRGTHDRLFAIFAAAFWTLAINRLLAAAAGETQELRTLIYYAVRLVAFVLILLAILDKNRSSRAAGRASS